MKYKCLVIFTVFLSYCGFSQSSDTLLKASYSVERLKNFDELKIEFAFSYSTCDTCKNVFKKIFGHIGSRTGPGVGDIQNTIIKEISKNENVQLFIEIPSYISEIIHLIKKEKDQEEALAIYRKNNIKNAASISNTHSTKTENNTTLNTNAYKITLHFTHKAPVSIDIPEQKFTYNGIMYTLQTFRLQL